MYNGSYVEFNFRANTLTHPSDPAVASPPASPPRAKEHGRIGDGLLLIRRDGMVAACCDESRDPAVNAGDAHYHSLNISDSRSSSAENLPAGIEEHELAKAGEGSLDGSLGCVKQLY